MPRLFTRNVLGSRTTSTIISLCFVAIFGYIGYHFINYPHAATPQNCTLTAILQNPCRPLIGAAANGNPGAPSGMASQFNYLEQLIGNQMDVVRDYHAPLTVTNNSNSSLPLDPNTKEGQAEISMADSGKILDLNWDVSHDWKQAMPVNQGGDATINSEIDQAATNIKKLPHKVFLSPWHEANLHVAAVDNSNESCSHFNTSAGYGTPDQFNAAWQNIYNHFKADGVTNVVWVLNYGSYEPNNCWIPYMWPGNSEVDWVIVDTYSSFKHYNWDQSAGYFYKNVLQANSTSTRNFDSKPWGIGEFGDGDAPDPQQTYDYYNSITAAVKAGSYPKYQMYLIYADTGNNAGPGELTDYEPDGTKDTQKQQIVNTMFSTILGQGSGGNPTPAVSLSAPSNGATVSGSVTVTAAASVSSGSITSLVLKAGGATLKSCASGTCSASWDTTKLTNGSYTLEADTTASDGNTNSITESVTVKNSQSVNLSVPTNLNSPSQTTKAITLAWNASTDSKYPASQLTYGMLRNGAAISTTAAGITQDTDTNLAPGTYYSYTVYAKDPSGNASDQSAALAVKTKTPNCAKPAAPQGFSGTAASPTSVNLTWKTVPNPSSTCVVTGYVVSRNQTPLALPTAISYTDITATPNTTYSYSVLAVETGNIAGPSSSVSVTTPQSQVTDPGPSAPANVAATAVSDTQVNLTWRASTDSVTGIKQYEILRNGSQVGTSTSTSFGDSNLSAHTQYTYLVVAVSGGNMTASSDSVNVTTLNSPTSTSGGSGSSGSTPVASLPPVLQGTTSVGSGSDTGQSSSDNPTNPGSSTSGLLGTNTTNTTPSKGLTAKKVAFVGGSTLGALVLLIAAMYWFVLRPKKFQFKSSGRFDPDFNASFKHIVVGDKRGPHGPQEPPGGGA